MTSKGISNSLLHFAAKGKSLQVLQIILQLEVLEVNGVNEDKDTPLHILSKHVPPSYDTELLCSLLKHGALPNSPNTVGATPLHYCAATGKLSWCKLLLLQDRVAINQQDIRGESPIHYATRYVKSKVVTFLIEQSADVSVQGVEGSPLDILLARRASKAAKLAV